MIKAAIFDFDGTLADTMPDLVTSLSRMRAHFGYEPVTRTQVLRAVNNATPKYVRLCLPEDFDESRMDEAMEAYYAAYEECYLDKTVPYPGVPEALEKFKSEGILLAVMSNKDDRHVKKMTDTLFSGMFDAAWGTVADVPAKPNPARAFLIAEAFGVRPEETAFIGDSDFDMITAVNAGMVPVGVTWGYRDAKTLMSGGAAYLAGNADDLYHIIKSI